MLDDCHSIVDLRDRARRRLPRPVFDFLDGGAETEHTAYENVRAFDDVKLMPRCLAATTHVNTTTTILGQKLAWPLLCSPTGASRLFDPQGELAVARAASASGSMYFLSAAATRTIEEVATASPAPKVFQLYAHDRAVMLSLVERCREAGYAAICLTVDVPVMGKRERDLRSGFTLKPKWTLASMLSFARHPRWITQRLGKGAISLVNYRDHDLAAPPPALGWDDVRALAELWGGPFAIKGIMAADDARRAADAGATAVIVSNHGGRQLDGAAASIQALPAIVQAVGDRLEVILDGGIRRGTHVLKAMALGAKACAIGRPYLFGLAAGGQAGVSKALDTLRAEFVMAMQLAGCASLADIRPDLIGSSS